MTSVDIFRPTLLTQYRTVRGQSNLCYADVTAVSSGLDSFFFFKSRIEF